VLTCGSFVFLGFENRSVHDDDINSNTKTTFRTKDNTLSRRRWRSQLFFEMTRRLSGTILSRTTTITVLSSFVESSKGRWIGIVEPSIWMITKELVLSICMDYLLFSMPCKPMNGILRRCTKSVWMLLRWQERKTSSRKGQKESTAYRVMELAKEMNISIAEVDKGDLNTLSGNRPYHVRYVMLFLLSLVLVMA
jgi:hypothetical protein